MEEAIKNTQLVVTLLRSLGFTIILKKSLLIPTQVLTFLGFKIDSLCMMISLPAEKANKILDCCHRLLVFQGITLRNLASLIGLLESSRPAIWRAPLHFRHLQSDLIRGLQMNQESNNAFIALSLSARVELAWWLKHTLNANGSPVLLPPPDIIITTDASKKGWGAVHQSLQTNGRWSQRESLHHINYLELKASLLALKTFLKGKSHITVSLQLDNTTAISYINNKGGTCSPQLMTLALEMWDSRCPSLASPALVASFAQTSNISASVATEQSNPLNGPAQPEQSSSNVSSPSLGRVSHLYQRFQAEGIPTNVTDLLIVATRTSTHRTYESSWNRWCRWCSGRQIHPLSSSINDILIFLTEVFNEGLAYRSLNVLRSAISSTHPKIDGFFSGPASLRY